MTVQNRIHQKLTEKFSPVHLELENESHMHSVPKDSETHFRVVLVSEAFNGLSRVARNRLVYECLSEELKNGVHALAQRMYTPEEWQKMGGSIEAPSPQCLGGSKHDKS